MKIAFFRNVQNFSQLCHKTDQFHGIIAECQIIDTVELDENDYNEFCSNFIKSYTFLRPYIYKTIIVNDIWLGILVKSGSNSIVVVMNGYQYAKYVGLVC